MTGGTSGWLVLGACLATIFAIITWLITLWNMLVCTLLAVITSISLSEFALNKGQLYQSSILNNNWFTNASI